MHASISKEQQSNSSSIAGACAAKEGACPAHLEKEGQLDAEALCCSGTQRLRVLRQPATQRLAAARHR